MATFLGIYATLGQLLAAGPPPSNASDEVYVGLRDVGGPDSPPSDTAYYQWKQGDVSTLGFPVSIDPGTNAGNLVGGRWKLNGFPVPNTIPGQMPIFSFRTIALMAANGFATFPYVAYVEENGAFYDWTPFGPTQVAPVLPAPDGYAAVAATGMPTGYAGEFLLLNATSVPTLAMLANIKDQGQPIGTFYTETRSINVATLDSFFDYYPTATTTADGITIINSFSSNAGASPGRWVRRPEPTVRWMTQAVWKIDPTAGNDEAAGGVGTPIKTWTEFLRRVGMFPMYSSKAGITSVDVEILADMPDSDPIVWRPIIEGGCLVTVRGQRTVLASGSWTGDTAKVTGSAPVNAAARTAPVAYVGIDAARASFAAFVGKQVVLTSGGGGASGAFATIATAPAANQARFIQNFQLPSTTDQTSTITVADAAIVGLTYDIFEVTTVGVVDIRASGSVQINDGTAAWGLLVKNLNIMNAASAVVLPQSYIAGDGVPVGVQTCECRNAGGIMSFRSVGGFGPCAVLGGDWSCGGALTIAGYGGGVTIFQGLARIGFPGIFDGEGNWNLRKAALQSTNFGVYFTDGGPGFGRCDDVGMFDWDGAAYSLQGNSKALQINTSSWGTSAQANSFSVQFSRGGGRMFYLSTDLPKFNVLGAGSGGAGNDIIIGSRATCAALDVTNFTYAAAARQMSLQRLNSDFAAATPGFGQALAATGAIFDPQTGCGYVKG